MQPHIDATHERISQCNVVLLVQETTELNLTRPDQQVAGAGPMDCELVFSPSEWKSVYTIVHGGKLPKTPPRLNDLIRMIATLGGYVDHPKTEPGTQTLRTGLQRLHCFSIAWDTFGPKT